MLGPGDSPRRDRESKGLISGPGSGVQPSVLHASAQERTREQVGSRQASEQTETFFSSLGCFYGFIEI